MLKLGKFLLKILSLAATWFGGVREILFWVFFEKLSFTESNVCAILNAFKNPDIRYELKNGFFVNDKTTTVLSIASFWCFFERWPMKFVQELLNYKTHDSVLFNTIPHHAGVTLHLTESGFLGVDYYIKVSMVWGVIDVWFYIVDLTEKEVTKIKAFSDEEIIEFAFDNLRFSPELLARLYDGGYDAGIQYAKLCMKDLLSKI